MIHLWYAALGSPLGVIVHTGDPSQFEPARQRLYAARRHRADPDLDHIAICQSPVNPADLWLVRKPRKEPLDGPSP